MASTIRAVGTQHWAGKARSPSNARWLKRALGAAQKRDRSKDYYRGSWFFEGLPKIPTEYYPPQGDVLVAYLDGKAAGTVAIYRMDDEHCELKSMFVEPQCRGHGVASALCKSMINLARIQAYHTVRLTTGVRQEPARHLYERLGFKIVTPWDKDPSDGYDYFEFGIAQ